LGYDALPLGYKPGQAAALGPKVRVRVRVRMRVRARVRVRVRIMRLRVRVVDRSRV